MNRLFLFSHKKYGAHRPTEIENGKIKIKRKIQNYICDNCGETKTSGWRRVGIRRLCKKYL